MEQVYQYIKKNGFTSFRKAGRDLGLHHQTISNIIRKLQLSGVLSDSYEILGEYIEIPSIEKMKDIILENQRFKKAINKIKEIIVSLGDNKKEVV